MTLKDLIKKAQTAMGLTPDGDWGPISTAKGELYDLVDVKVVKKPEEQKPLPVPAGEKVPTPWMDEAKTMDGQVESNPTFNKKMSAKWPMLGLNLGTIAKNWAAWCGLFVAVSLGGAGVAWQKNGAAAVNWLKYGQKIEWHVNGIPRGAILEINHGGLAKCGSSSSNHVTFSDGDCAPQDLIEMVKGADGVYRPSSNPPKLKKVTVRGYGGNQGNRVTVSPYPVNHICGVRWPLKTVAGEPIALPGKVLKSNGCTGGKYTAESTR